MSTEIQAKLEAKLDRKKRREMFFFGNFNMEEETHADKFSLINRLMEEHKTNNNQFVPFEKIEGGFT